MTTFRHCSLGIATAWLACALAGVTVVAQVQENPTPTSEIAKRMIGTWKVDVAKSQAYRQQKDPNQGELPAGEVAELGKLVVQFHADGIIQVLRDGMAMQGRWKFVAEKSPRSADIELIRDDETTAATIEFTEDGGMAVAPARERALVFVPAPAQDMPAPAQDMPAPAQGKPAANPAQGQPLELKTMGKLFVGDWKGDAEETKKLEFNSQFEPDAVNAMLEQMKELELQVAEDGAFHAKFGLPDQTLEMTGTWRPLTDDDQKRTLAVQVNLEGGPNSKFDILFLDDQSIRMAPVDQPAIVLRRKPAAAQTK